MPLLPPPSPPPPILRVLRPLPRPNPLGDAVVGPVLDMAFTSFVGIWNITVRYGMTMGELAIMLNAEMGPSWQISLAGRWENRRVNSPNERSPSFLGRL